MKNKKIVKSAHIECPYCQGKGYYDMTSEAIRSLFRKEGQPYMQERFNKLAELNKSGKLAASSLREIGKIIGVKNPQSVKHAIARAKMLGYLD